MALVAIAILFVVPVVAIRLRLDLGANPDPSTIVVERNPLLDQPAPEISLATVDGRSMSLSELRGRPVIVNFWASWCGPCREEFPMLAAARDKYAGEGLEIVGVIHDDSTAAASAFAAGYHAAWPLLVDADDVAWTAYRGAFVPISYFVDRAGVIRAVSYGPPPSGVLEEEIAKIL